MILMTFHVVSQSDPRPAHLFIELGVDPIMAFHGPSELDNNKGTFSGEFKVGINNQNTLIGLGYQSQAAIKWQKISLFYEKKFTDKLFIFDVRNINTRAGFEASMIIIHDPIDDYRPVTHDWVQLGANLGVYYNIRHKQCDTGFEIGINTNAYRGGTHYRNQANNFLETFRADMMLVLVRNF